MKPSFQICFLFLFISHLAWSQQYAPGGVKGAVTWYAPAIDGKTWQSQLPHEELPSFDLSNAPQLNFNTGLWLPSGATSLVLPLENIDLHQSSVFTVYQTADTAFENSIWHLKSGDSTQQVLTTHRLADLGQGQYLNFPENYLGAPTLNTYLQHSPRKRENEPASLVLAERPEDRDLPIVSFKGLIPEIILFDRVVNPRERLQIESYLAIKYGLSLHQQEYITYLNAGGDTLWNGRHYPDFSHHITGIGRDDISGLRQFQSSCSYESGLLTIGVATLAQDQSFLLWGDNRRALQLAQRNLLEPTRFEREWHLQVSNISNSVLATFQLDSKTLHDLPKEDEMFWLKLTPANGWPQFYPATTTTKAGRVSFANIPVTTGSHQFTFSIGPKMMVTSLINAPKCQNEEDGTLSLRILGGRAPFACHLIAKDHPLSINWQSNDHDWQPPRSLPAGNYSLVLTDADGLQYREDFFFQAEDAPVSLLENSYPLPEKGKLLLNAGIGLTEEHLSFHWLTPDGQEIHQPTLEIRQPGTYQLTIDRQGCISQQDILIEPTENSPFQSIELFPNPSPDGHFQLRVLMKTPANVQLDIYHANGQHIQSQRGKDRDYHLFNGHLPASGIYVLSLTSNGKTASRKLIIE